MKSLRSLLLLFLLIMCTFSLANSKDSIAESKTVIKKDTSSQKEIIGKFAGTNEDGDYWFFYIRNKDSTEIRFIYNSEEILKNKDKYIGKTLLIKYVNKEFEEAGS